MKVSQTSFKKILKYYTTRKTQEDVAREQKSEKRKSEIEKRREEENKFTASLGFIMGRYLAENCPEKVLVLAESDYKTSTYTKLVVGGLKEGLGKEAQVVVDTVKVPGYNMPEEEIPPLPDIMTARDFDAAVDGHPDCKVIVSMIWLSRDVENMKLWTKKNPPKLAVISAYGKMDKLIADGMIAAVTIAKPYADYESRYPGNFKDAFDMRYLLVTTQNIKSIKEKYGNILGR
jgi:hypothetical protein